MSDSQSGEDGGLVDDDDFDESDLDLDDGEDEEVFDLFNRTKGGKKRKLRLELNELQELLRDAETDVSDLTPAVNGVVSPQKKRKARKESPSLDQEEISEPPKKKIKTDKKDRGSAKSTNPRTAAFDLVEPDFEYSVPKPTSSSSVSDIADSFGEQTTLQSFDAADKNARKKSLRFHTSKIEGAALRRDKGTKNLLGGDDDIPYKERKRQKEIREAKDSAKKSRGFGGDDLSDGDPNVDMDVDLTGFNGEIGAGKALGELSEDFDPGEYYSLVKRSAKERKEKRKVEYDAAKVAQRYGFSASCPRAHRSFV